MAAGDDLYVGAAGLGTTRCLSWLINVLLLSCTAPKSPHANTSSPADETGAFEGGDTGMDVDDSGPVPDSGEDPEDTGGSGTLTLSWSRSGAAPAREFRFASIPPDDPHRVYLGSARSGLFFSSTIPPSFERVTAVAKHFYSPVLVPPGDLETRIVSAGNAFWLSRDSSVSWEKRTPLWPDSDFSIWSGASYVTGLDADDTRVVLSDDLGRVWVSVDSGEHFSHVGTVPPPDSTATKHGGEGVIENWSVQGTAPLILDDDQMLLAWDGGAVFRSEDAGVTWAEVLTGEGNRNAIAASGGKVYVGMETGVYVSEDDGRTFVQDLDGPEHCIDLDRSGDTMALACDGVLWIHDGAEYARLDTAEEVQSVAVAPSDPSVLMAGMVEGMVWSSDGGVTLESVTDELVTKDIYVVKPHPLAPSTLLGTTFCTTGVYRSEDRAETWTAIPTSAHYTMSVRHAPSDPDRVYITNSRLPGHGDLQRSDDGGLSFEMLDIPDADTNHPHALAVLPDDADTLLIGTSSDRDDGTSEPHLFLSEDGGASWVQVGDGLSAAFHAIIAAEYDPEVPGTVYIGTGPGGTDHASEATVGEDAVGSGDGLWRSRDGGENFERVAGGMDGLNIWDIGFAPSGSLFATSESGVFRSEDRGETWAQVLPLEDADRVEIGFSLAQPDWAAVSTEGALWISTDDGRTWVSYWEDFSEQVGPFGGSVGISDVDFSVDGASLYVASRHRGVWMADVNSIREE
jgi:photosystem II stability/assembly factor-like uncharacterized protein